MFMIGIYYLHRRDVLSLQYTSVVFLTMKNGNFKHALLCIENEICFRCYIIASGFFVVVVFLIGKHNILSVCKTQGSSLVHYDFLRPFRSRIDYHQVLLSFV